MRGGPTRRPARRVPERGGWGEQPGDELPGRLGRVDLTGPPGLGAEPLMALDTRDGVRSGDPLRVRPGAVHGDDPGSVSPPLSLWSIPRWLQGVKPRRCQSVPLPRGQSAIEPGSDRRTNAVYAAGLRIAAVTGPVTVSERRKRRSPGNVLSLVVIGLRTDRSQAPTGIRLGRLLARPVGRAANLDPGGGERWGFGTAHRSGPGSYPWPHSLLQRPTHRFRTRGYGPTARFDDTGCRARFGDQVDPAVSAGVALASVQGAQSPLGNRRWTASPSEST